VVGAIHAAHRVGRPNIITLDMGGTSTDICLIRDGKAVLAFDRSVAEFPVRLPMLDINTIGAGGGSILWFDVDGLLKVGPQSAGADPGPACYGKGGQEPTVSDANLVLGRLPRRGLLQGRMPLDDLAARYALEPFADPMGYSVERTAHGVIEVAVSNMVRAIRAISVERGHDPRDFSLMTFGGAGPLHATDVARSLGIREVIVPAAPGILCAQGLLASDLKEDFVATVRTPLADGCEATLQGVLQKLNAKANEWFDHERVAAPQRHLSAALDMRYVGQNFELQIDLGPYEAGEPIVPPPVDRLRRLFLAAHEMHYGYCTEDDPVEIITYRLTARGQLRREEVLAGPPSSGGSVEPLEHRRVYWSPDRGEDTPVYDRSAFGAGTRLVGPAVIEQLDATTLLFHGDALRVDDDLNLIIELP
jgi:N-methylhydantoinase A